jgi:hypothetical protein
MYKVISDDENEYVEPTTAPIVATLPPPSFKMPPRDKMSMASHQVKWDRVVSSAMDSEIRAEPKNEMYLDREKYHVRQGEDHCERCQRLGWPCMESSRSKNRKACLTCQTQTCSSAKKVPANSM